MACPRTSGINVIHIAVAPITQGVVHGCDVVVIAVVQAVSQSTAQDAIPFLVGALYARHGGALIDSESQHKGKDEAKDGRDKEEVKVRLTSE